MRRPTKPNEPMRRAEDARNMVGIGKARMEGQDPGLLQTLPIITTRPDQTKRTKRVGQYTRHYSGYRRHTVRRPGGPIHHTHRSTSYNVRRLGLRPGYTTRWGPTTLTPRPPAIAPAKAYDPIIDCEGSYFGKEFLRMAGIVQMLHLRKGSNDT